MSALLKFYQFLKNLSSCSNKEIQETKSKYPTMTDKNCNNLIIVHGRHLFLAPSVVASVQLMAHVPLLKTTQILVLSKRQILVLAYYQ